MKKRLLALMLSLIMCFTLFGCNTENSGAEETLNKEPDTTVTATSETETEESEQNDAVTTKEQSEATPTDGSSPLLYKVTDENGNVLWLFGSIHVGRDDFYPLPEYVLDAFEHSDALAVEADIVAFENDLASQIKALQLLLYTDGTTIKDHISEEAYNSAVEILKNNNLYAGTIDYYVPSLWSNLVDNCSLMQVGADGEKGIDRHLINLAKDSGKEIFEIESAAFQYSMLAGFSDELQVYLLESSIEAYGDLETAKKEITDMMDLWASGDEQAFSEYLNTVEEFTSAEEELLYEEYNNALIVSRNKSMTDYAENALKSGKEIFICVGAAHVIGEGAIAEELRLLGYNVEIVK